MARLRILTGQVLLPMLSSGCLAQRAATPDMEKRWLFVRCACGQPRLVGRHASGRLFGAYGMVLSLLAWWRYPFIPDRVPGALP
ncbi:MAG TPA: hypothetical protein QGH10_05320 [Armatimonadota bacterium]|nr:hypothetical protein [Armatimonadota bacterium]